jgi:hypothetical protein
LPVLCEIYWATQDITPRAYPEPGAPQFDTVLNTAATFTDLWRDDCFYHDPSSTPATLQFSDFALKHPIVIPKIDPKETSTKVGLNRLPPLSAEEKEEITNSFFRYITNNELLADALHQTLHQHNITQHAQRIIQCAFSLELQDRYKHKASPQRPTSDSDLDSPLVMDLTSVSERPAAFMVPLSFTQLKRDDDGSVVVHVGIKFMWLTSDHFFLVFHKEHGGMWLTTDKITAQRDNISPIIHISSDYRYSIADGKIKIEFIAGKIIFSEAMAREILFKKLALWTAHPCHIDERLFLRLPPEEKLSLHDSMDTLATMITIIKTPKKIASFIKTQWQSVIDQASSLAINSDREIHDELDGLVTAAKTHLVETPHRFFRRACPPVVFMRAARQNLEEFQQYLLTTEEPVYAPLKESVGATLALSISFASLDSMKDTPNSSASTHDFSEEAASPRNPPVGSDSSGETLGASDSPAPDAASLMAPSDLYGSGFPDETAIDPAGAPLTDGKGGIEMKSLCSFTRHAATSVSDISVDFSRTENRSGDGRRPSARVSLLFDSVPSATSFPAITALKMNPSGDS